MIRLILGVFGGVFAFFAISAVSGFVVTAAWPDYAAVREAMTFTLSMQLMRLALGVVALIIAGVITGWIARSQIQRSSLILGVVLLIIFIPVHINLWDKFPLWYHAWFLLTIIPFCLLGGKIIGLREKQT